MEGALAGSDVSDHTNHAVFFSWALDTCLTGSAKDAPVLVESEFMHVPEPSEVPHSGCPQVRQVFLHSRSMRRYGLCKIELALEMSELFN